MSTPPKMTGTDRCPVAAAMAIHSGPMVSRYENVISSLRVQNRSASAPPMGANTMLGPSATAPRSPTSIALPDRAYSRKPAATFCIQLPSDEMARATASRRNAGCSHGPPAKCARSRPAMPVPDIGDGAGDDATGAA